MAETNLLANLETAFPGKILESSILHCDETIIVAREDAPAIFTTLRNAPEFAFELLVDLTVVDFFGKEPRFEVVYHLKSLSVGHRLRVKIRVTEDDPVVPTVSSIWKSGKHGICLAFVSPAILICVVSSCMKNFAAIRCAKTIRLISANRSSKSVIQ